MNIPRLTVSTFDEQMMTLAAAVSLRSRFNASPNPWVGAIAVAKDGTLATGSTQNPGSPHAEVMAINKLGHRTRGASLWVTLEPCAHFGKTPPCVNAIIDSGISRVVIATRDPDPRVNGNGILRLKEAGVDVVTGVLAPQVTEILAPYLVSRILGRPFVILKMATTLDGYTAAKDYSSKWITNSTSRERVQELRKGADIIVVGANTIRHDNPSLRVVTEDMLSPKRVVFGDIPQGANVLPASSFKGKPNTFITSLSSNEALTVLVEGGATLAHSFLQEDLVDEFHLFIAPKLIGGSYGVRLFEGEGASNISAAKGLEVISSNELDGDIEIILRSNQAIQILNELNE